jgi:putative peptidoglycan lipid II flippase
MAVASLASRITGFLRTLALVAALGIAVSTVADAYNVANTLPNMVYTLLIGGVLSSVIIPLIVHAQEHDPDRGEHYTQRLLSWGTAGLAIVTTVAVIAAPWISGIFPAPAAERSLITIFATLLLPEIFFYGLGALYTAVLNTRGVYGPPAWASVLNNVVTIVTVGVFALLPGPSVLTEKSITTPQILVLGIGTTLGIVVQALVLIPFMRRSGYRWRWRFRASSVETVPMSEVRALAGWVLGYVAFSQIGVYVINRVAIRYKGGVSTFTYGDLLFQMPYGIIAVSLLTALMPRISRSAARDDSAGVVADLSLGARLSAVGLVPITGFLMVLGPTMVTVIFAYGRSDATDSRNVGTLLALGAFGLLPFAIVMLQLRVFYAMRDTRTPTLINAFMVGTKVLLVLVFAAILHGDRVVIWLEFVTSSSYLVGAIVGHVLLTRRFGRLGFSAVARTTGRIAAVTAVGSVVALGVLLGIEPVVGRGPAGSAVTLVAATIAGGAVLVGLLRVVRIAEVDQMLASLRRSRS